MRLVFKTLASMLVSGGAFGATVNPPVYQSGNVTPTHGACWTTNGVVQDCGAVNPVLAPIFASPPQIGNHIPNAGFFTTLNAATGVFPTLTAGSLFKVFPTNLGSSSFGLIMTQDSNWTPPIGQNNQYFGINVANTGLSNGTVAERWATTSFLDFTSFATTGPPSGVPSSPSGSADSHTIGKFVFGSIPAGLCDGLGGSGFSGPGGSPGNNCYQELGGVDVQLTSLSPGHLLEGVSSQVFDTSFGSGTPVATALTGFTAGIFKNSADNLYQSMGFIANSLGTQQSTFAPDSAFRVNGGWKIGLDLTTATIGTADIMFSGNQSISRSGGFIQINVQAGGVAINSTNATSAAFAVNDAGAGGSRITLSEAAGTKTLRALATNFAILNNAGNAVVTMTDAGVWDAAGGFSRAGAVGVTCGPGSPSGSWATSLGIVTHC